MRSSCRTRTRTTSPGLPCCCSGIASVARSSRGCSGPVPDTRRGQRNWPDAQRRAALLAAGDRLAVDDIALEVLWPMPGSVPREPPDTGTGINNVSIVLLGSVAGRRFLLAGDIEEEVDPELLARARPRGPAQDRPPRQPNRVHGCLPRRRRSGGGRGVGRHRQSVRSPLPGDAVADRGEGCPRPPDGP